MKKILLLSLIVLFVSSFIVLNFKGVQDEHLFLNNVTTIRVYRNKTKTIDVVPFEEYIVGVLAGEMPVSFDIESLKAQAVASRSYALKRMISNKNKNYDVVDTVSNQVYLDLNSLKNIWKDNYDDNLSKLLKAVLETKGEYLTYNGSVIDALFFSTSTGVTENSEDVFGNSFPYLKSVVSTWDEISPVYQITKKYLTSEFLNKLNLKGDTLNIKYINISKTGKVSKISINNNYYGCSTLANTFSLKSCYFTIEENDGYVFITTKGYGHGVGMSQYGAYAMALKGYKYDEILKYYYTGVEIEKL